MTKPIRAYKAFNQDLTCREFQYEIGKIIQDERETRSMRAWIPCLFRY